MQGYPLVRPGSASCSTLGTFSSVGHDSRNGHQHLVTLWWWNDSASLFFPLGWWWLLEPFGGLPSLWQVHLWLKCLTSITVESGFALSECHWAPALPIHSAACPLSASSVHLPITACTAEIQANSYICTPGDRGPWPLLCWSGAPLIRWWRHLPADLDVGGHAGSLCGSFILPLFSSSEWLGETFLGESGGGVAPVPPNMVTHPRTSQHPYAAPFL